MPSRSLRFLAASYIFSGRSRQTFIFTFAVLALGLPGVISSKFEAANSCLAQEQIPATSQEPQPDLEKAMKYHSALLRRPTPGYLYDRFYNTWLDTSSLEDLKQFLVERTNSSKAQAADRLLLAFFYAKQGKDVEALQQFRIALKNNPDNAATLYEMAIIEARTLDFESAIENLSKAAKAKPSSEESIKIALLRGKLLVRNRQTEEAAKAWDELTKNNPDDLGLMEDLIELQISEGMFEQAEALSERLIAKTKDPLQKVIRALRKGDILQRGGSQTEALEVYGNTLAQVGLNTWIEREILGQVEQLFRREDDLIGLNTYLAKLTETNSKRIAIRKTRAKVLMELGQVDDAIEVYEKIIELTPGSRENREAFTSLLISADKNELAVKQMESLVAQHSKDAELQVRLAELCHKISAPQKSKAALDKFVTLSGGTEYSYLRAARLFEKFKDLDSAKAAYQTAIEKFQESDSVQEAWADFLFRSDEKDEAVKVWQQLAQGTDRSGLVRLARLVSVRNLNQVAMDMLLARYDDFKLDSIYLGQLCTEAIALKKYSEAVTWATERVRLAKTSGEVESALPPALTIINSAKQSESVIESLQDKQGRSAVETCLLVELLDRSSLNNEAESILRTSFDAIKTTKDNQGIQILARQRVRLARGRQDWVGAAKAARELLNLPGGRKSPNVRQLIELYVRTEDDKSALKWIAEWKRLSPGSLLPWLSEATLLERGGKTKESIAVLRRATQAFPDDQDLFGQLAQKYRRYGQPKDAERIFWQQYENSEKLSDKIRWAEQLAKLAQDEGDIDQLVKSFQERRKNNPQSIEPLLSIAQTHRIAGNYEERRAALIEATRLKKEDPSLLFEIAKMEESEGDWEKAIQTLERASLVDKSNRAKQRIAQLYLQYGETKEGLSRLLEIAGGANATADDIEKISQSISENKNWEELLEFLGPNVVRFPNNYRLGFLMAIANEELGNTEVAKNQFVELLQADQEIPGRNLGKNNQRQSRLGYYEGAVPQDAIDLMSQLTEIPSLAYAYRQNNRSNGHYGPSVYGLSSSTKYLPSDLDSCFKFSLCHLCEIARDLPDEERDSLQRQVKRLGVENANLLMAGLSSQDVQSDPMTLLEIAPDSKVALAVAATSSGNGRAELSQEVYLKAYETFKESYPAIGLFAANSLDQTKPENQARLAAAVDRLKTLEEPNLLIVTFVGRRGYQSDEDKDDPLKAHRAELNQLLFDWYPKLAANPKMSAWTFSLVVNSFRKEDSPKPLIEILNQELDRIKGQGKLRSAFNTSSYGRGRSKAILLPSYPPTKLLAFPESIYSLLKMPRPKNPDGLGGSSYYYNSRNVEPDNVLSADQIAMAVETTKDPTMKVLLELKYFYQREQEQQDQETGASKPAAALPDSIKAAFGDQVTDAKSAIDQLFEISKTNVDAWYLAGCLAAHEKRWDDAAANFETMRSLPMTAATRRQIDGHLVALATLGLADELANKANKKVTQSAKSAALRLRRGRLSQEQRAALVSAFELLELNDEAKKMESQIAKAANAANVARASAGSPVNVDRIKKLSEAGKIDAAARLLSQEFQTLARESLDLTSTNNRRYELDDFKRKVQSLDLEQELLKQLDPGSSANARKLGVWAFANETFDKPDVADGLYEKLLEAYPKQDAARARIVMLKIKEGDKQAFARHYPQVNKRSRDQFLAGILKLISTRTIAAKDLLALIESVVDYKEGPDGDTINEESMANLLSILGSRFAINPTDYQSVLPSPYTVISTEDETSENTSSSKKYIDSEEGAQLIKQQRILHDRVARRMSNSSVPTQPGKAFTALLGSAEAAGEPVGDEMVALALKTVYPKKDRRRSSQRVFFDIYPNQWGATTRKVTLRTPVEFLARHYGLGDIAADQQIEEIAEKLESARNKDAAAELRNIYALCRAKNDDYASIASELIASTKGKQRRPNEQELKKVMSTIVEVWRERKLKADISKVLVAYVAGKKGNQYGTSTYNGIPYQSTDTVVTDFVTEIAELNGVSKAEEFMTQLRFELLGSEEEQQELAKLAVDQETMRKNMKKLEPAGTYVFFARALTEGKKRKTFWLGVKEMQRFSFPRQPKLTGYQVRSLLGGFKENELDAQLDWLKQGDFLVGLSDFDPRNEKSDSSESLWGDALEQMRYSFPNQLKDQTSERLSAKADPTFGEKLLLSFAKQEPADIYQLLGSELETFKALPEQQKVQLARFANEINEIDTIRVQQNKKFKLAVSEESKAAKEICVRLRSKSMEAAVAKLMQAKRFDDLHLQTHEFKDWSKTIIASMRVEKPQEILAAAAQLSKFSADKKLDGRVRRYNITFKASLIEEVAAKDISIDSLKLMLDALEKEDFEDVNFTGSLSDSMIKFLKSLFDTNKTTIRKQNEKMSSGEGSVESVKQMINQFGDKFGDRELTVFIPELRGVLPTTKGSGEALDKWLHSDDSVKYPMIKETFRLAFDYRRGAKYRFQLKGKAKTNPEDPQPSQDYLEEILKFINDDVIPLQSRSRVAVNLVQYDVLSPEEVAACCRVIAQGIDAGEGIESLPTERIFTALIASEDTPDIKEARSVFVKSWAQSKLQENPSNYRKHNLINCIKLFDLNGEKAEVPKLLNSLKLSDSTELTVALIELGYFKEAKKQCETNWKNTTFWSYTRRDFTKKLETQMPEFLKIFNDKGEKYFAEVYLSWLQNHRLEGKLETSSESRLNEVAKRFSSDVFKSKNRRQTALILLSDTYPKSEVIGQALTKEVEGMSVESLMNSNDNVELKLRLLSASLSNQINLENFAPVQAVWKQANEIIMEKYSDNIPWRAKSFLDKVGESVNESLYRSLRDKTPDQIAKFLPAIRDLNQSSYQRPLNPTLAQVAHLMAGRPDELIKFLAEQDAYLKANDKPPADRATFVTVFLADLNRELIKIKTSNLAAKKNLVTMAWKFASEQGINFQSKAFEIGTMDPKKSRTKYGIGHLERLRIVDQKELPDLAFKLATINSVNGEIWAQMARRQVAAKNDARAAEYFKKSIEDAKEDMQKAKFNRRVEYAKTLVRLKRNDEAKKMIDGIPAEELFKANKKTLETLQKTLQEALEETVQETVK